MELIKLVLEEKKTIKFAAQKMRISPSTARVIVRRYEDEGSIFQKKEDQN